MSQSNISDLIFEKWTASLKSRDRSRTGVPTNFDDLFLELHTAGVSFDEAHNILPLAIKAHLPSKAVSKQVYLKIKSALHLTEPEFFEEWCNSIKATGTEMFFCHYPLKTKDDDDGEPKVYGNMSVKEYKLQRRYADAFPRLNTDELEREMKQRRSEDLDLTGDILREVDYDD